MTEAIDYTHVLDFWFEELEPRQWWTKDASVDALIVERFSALYARAVRCELYRWRTEPGGRLAEIIVLDQFSRNMFRDSCRAFAYDSQALALAQEAVALGVDKLLDQQERNFLYMPYMHSESLAIHDVAVKLFQSNEIETSLDYEHRHREIILRFGRYPHRNKVLGRDSTQEEINFLEQPGSSF
jgi:uncharacterized protein (DUF924 family)